LCYNIVMVCHLIEEAGKGTLDWQTIKETVVVDENAHLADSDKFDVSIGACKVCGQKYIVCFREFNSAKFEDFYWNFWIPIREQEIAAFKQTEMTYPLMAAIVGNTPHICRGDKKTVYWCAQGNPLASTIFSPPYMVDYPDVS